MKGAWHRRSVTHRVFQPSSRALLIDEQQAARWQLGDAGAGQEAVLLIQVHHVAALRQVAAEEAAAVILLASPRRRPLYERRHIVQLQLEPLSQQSDRDQAEVIRRDTPSGSATCFQSSMQGGLKTRLSLRTLSSIQSWNLPLSAESSKETEQGYIGDFAANDYPQH